MKEIFQKLLESELLTPETKAELSQAIEAFTSELTESVQSVTEQRVRSDLTEQWIAEREVLVEALDSKVGQFLTSELTELKSDIDRFRDLEAEYAEKLVQERAVMASELKSDMAKLVEDLDMFLSENLKQEFEELREDLEEVKKIQFGRRIFEAFYDEFNTNYIDEEDLQSKLHEVTSQLEESKQQLVQAQQDLQVTLREAKIVELLTPLTGTSREVMETILSTTATEKLDETYSVFINRVVQQKNPTEKETTVLAEGKTGEKPTTVVKTGDLLTEGQPHVEGLLSEADKAKLRAAAGIV